MKRRLFLILATTALTAPLGLSAWSAMSLPWSPDAPGTSLVQDGRTQAPFLLVDDDDDDDDDDHRDRRRKRHHHDDDDDDDDDDGQRRTGANPAPAGTAAPPKNGLFNNGAPPQVRVN